MDRYSNVWETDNLDSILTIDNSTICESNFLSSVTACESIVINETNNHSPNADTVSIYTNRGSFLNFASNSTNVNNNPPEEANTYCSPSQSLNPPHELRSQWTTHSTQATTQVVGVPESIQNVHHNVTSSLSDFTFVYVISAQLCQEIMPMECYVEFKMGLLLSLASITANTSPLHVVGIGQDTSFANMLMGKIGNLAKRFIISLEKVTSSSLKHENVVEANPILLGSSGVYYGGDLPTMNDTWRGRVFRDITCGNVSVDNTFITYPLDTAIWCHWSNYKNNKKDQNTFGALLKVFGIPFVLQETSSEKLIDFLLEQAMLTEDIVLTDGLNISMDDMRSYIAFVSSQNVEMPDDCADLLQRYFVASRLDRPGCLPEKAYISLRQMSESFAKLSFRNLVTSIDVIGAIYLAEHFIFHTFGAGVFPPPILVVGNDVENVEIMIKGFSEWLNIYLSRFSSNNNSQSIG